MSQMNPALEISGPHVCHSAVCNCDLGSCLISLWWKCESLLQKSLFYFASEQAAAPCLWKKVVQDLYPKRQRLSAEMITLTKESCWEQFYSPGRLSELAPATENKRHEQQKWSSSQSFRYWVQAVLSLGEYFESATCSTLPTACYLESESSWDTITQVHAALRYC